MALIGEIELIVDFLFGVFFRPPRRYDRKFLLLFFVPLRGFREVKFLKVFLGVSGDVRGDIESRPVEEFVVGVVEWMLDSADF